ncbi:galactinol synthase [Podospora fimiseda]|uniref:Galactinol synthase n=1 Tax=Podospora fimiseda TaxID=252190 RepID=A0AAN7GZU1_9PEZI|nr:galactinol synthase [Podospora fimiseda]
MSNNNTNPPINSDKVWTTLITNISYLSGLLTLHHSLLRVNSSYPLLALYTDSFPLSSLSSLHSRGISTLHIPHILPPNSKSYSNDPRFIDCWTKLIPFSFTQFTKIIQLDSDMLILRNMDELFSLSLNNSTRLFAAGHACVCNPLQNPHYPKSWNPQNCAFNSPLLSPKEAQTSGGNPLILSPNLSYCNGGLQVVQPSLILWNQIQNYMNTHAAELDFADQSVLSELFKGKWVALPYIYNALKTMRWEGVHRNIWMDDKVKNIHYILTPKPWEIEEDDGLREEDKETHKWWKEMNEERKRNERERGISDEWS